MDAMRQSANDGGMRGGATPRELEIWCIDLDASGSAISQAWQNISDAWGASLQVPSDDAASARSHPVDARKTAADAALRCLLSAHVGLDAACQPFARGPKGKPLIAGSDVHFSLSHSDGMAALAICKGAPVGIDIELVRCVRVSEHRRKQLENAAETVSMRPLSLDPTLRFLQAWVRLEAAAKATGEGIGALLTRLLPDRTLSQDQPETAERQVFDVHDLVLPNAAAAVAALAVAGTCNVPPISVFPNTPADIAELIAARRPDATPAALSQGTEDQRYRSPTAMLATYSEPSEWTPTRPRARLLRV